MIRPDPRLLIAAALAGRVAHTPFLEPDLADRILADLREAGVVYHRSGGYSGAVVTAYPSHMPVATTPLTALYYRGVGEPGPLGAAIAAQGIEPGIVGDLVSHSDGIALVCLAPPDGRLLEPVPVGGCQIPGREIDLKLLRAASVRRFDAVIPSLRVDAVGAKAFRVS